MCTVELARALADPQHVRRAVVPVAGQRVLPGERLLVAEDQRLVAGVEGHLVQAGLRRGADTAGGHEAQGAVDLAVQIGERLGEMLPLDAQFKDENGQIVKLGDYFGKGRPAIIALVYYECPMLCNQVLNGLTGSLKGVSFNAGKEFDVIAVSFDPKEFDKPELAKNKKESYMGRYGRPGTENGWHFLTGKQESIDAITKAAGFGYEWDEKSNQFARCTFQSMVINLAI